MAVPIKVVPKTVPSKIDIEADLGNARVAHSDAILSAYELLQDLHDGRVLDLLSGILGAGDSIVTKLAIAGSSQESINVARNLISMGRMLGSIDPEVLHTFANEFTAKQPRKEGPSFWRFVKSIVSADSLRTLGAGAAFLQAFGRALAKCEKEH